MNADSQGLRPGLSCIAPFGARQCLNRSHSRTTLSAYGRLPGSRVPRKGCLRRNSGRVYAIPEDSSEGSTDMPNSDPTLRVTLLPRDTNRHGTIFGGIILSHIDLAGAIESRRTCGPHNFVTVAMDGPLQKRETDSGSGRRPLSSPCLPYNYNIGLPLRQMEAQRLFCGGCRLSAFSHQPSAKS